MVLVTLLVASGGAGGVLAGFIIYTDEGKEPKPQIVEVDPTSPASEAFERALKAANSNPRTWAQILDVEAAIRAEADEVNSDPRLAKALEGLLANLHNDVLAIRTPLVRAGVACEISDALHKRSVNRADIDLVTATPVRGPTEPPVTSRMP